MADTGADSGEEPAVPTAADSGAAPEPVGADAAREALARARAAARAQVPPPTAGGPRTRPAPRRSGAGPDLRDPMLVGESVRRLIDDRGWSGPAAVAGVVGQWDRIVGAEVAEHVRPETFDVEQGRLVLRADSTAWATVLRAQLPTVVARIAEQVGAGVVRSITVAGPAAPSWKHGPRTVRGRGPRDTYG